MFVLTRRCKVGNVCGNQILGQVGEQGGLEKMI